MAEFLYLNSSCVLGTQSSYYTRHIALACHCISCDVYTRPQDHAAMTE